jgi:hypothetical protein
MHELLDVEDPAWPKLTKAFGSAWFTGERKDRAPVSRRPVPAGELWVGAFR